MRRRYALAVFLFACCGPAGVVSGFFQPSLTPRSLGLPVAHMKLADMIDTFHQPRGAQRTHEAVDILAVRGTAVLAVDDGTIVKLFWSQAGGRTIYQFDPSQHFCYYYAHLDAYAEHLAEAMHIQRGQVIGYVGSTGNAAATMPHLHFGITEIGPDKKWWGGKPLDPYPLLRASALASGAK